MRSGPWPRAADSPPFVIFHADGQVVNDDLANEGWNLFDAVTLGARGQRVQIGDDEEGVVLVLQRDAGDQAANVEAQVQPAGGPIAP